MGLKTITMQQWEYAYKTLEDPFMMRQMGENCWELAAHVNGWYIFKRPIGPDWKVRCEAAEAYISESPCDPDITAAQLKAYNKWQEIKNKV